MCIYDYKINKRNGEELPLSNYKNKPDIKWSFTKFLVNRNGEVVARFEPTEDMSKVEECIKALL